VPGAIEIVTRDDPRALELIRHDAAHVMAEAVQALWPGTQVTIGPVIENGFYYDFKRVHPDTREDWPFTPDDLPVIEKKMREIIQRNAPFTKEVWSRDKAKRRLCRHGRGLQGRTGRRDPGWPGSQDLPPGRLVRPVPRAAHGRDGPHRHRLQADEGAGRLLARRCRQADAERIYGTAWANQQDLDAYLHMLEEAEKRDHRRLGREMDLFHFQEEGPGVVFWHAKGWRMFQNAAVLHAPPHRGRL
jgi:threonyl-tRNA synthetase